MTFHVKYIRAFEFSWPKQYKDAKAFFKKYKLAIRFEIGKTPTLQSGALQGLAKLWELLAAFGGKYAGQEGAELGAVKWAPEYMCSLLHIQLTLFIANTRSF